MIDILVFQYYERAEKSWISLISVIITLVRIGINEKSQRKLSNNGALLLVILVDKASY